MWNGDFLEYQLSGLLDSLDSRAVFQTDSLVSGPLSSTSTFLAKVATSPQNDTPNYSHLICVYMPDVYDQGSVTEVREPGGLPSVPSSLTWCALRPQVMKVLLRNHGMNLMGVKTNLYTSIGK